MASLSDLEQAIRNQADYIAQRFAAYRSNKDRSNFEFYIRRGYDMARAAAQASAENSRILGDMETSQSLRTLIQECDHEQENLEEEEDPVSTGED